ncbi:MAG: hypothetical protein EBE86_014510 [Hormoscilla sp. GUM202]|nr:hypothetical protein [Hormoscilla sp. GUM202]
MSKEVKTITIEVPAEDWKYLEWEAEKFKTTPEAIAAKMINLYLRRPEKHLTPKEALESLRQLRKDMPGKDLPTIDAVKLVRESREELEQRGIFSQKDLDNKVKCGENDERSISRKGR